MPRRSRALTASANKTPVNVDAYRAMAWSILGVQPLLEKLSINDQDSLYGIAEGEYFCFHLLDEIFDQFCSGPQLFLATLRNCFDSRDMEWQRQMTLSRVCKEDSKIINGRGALTQGRFEKRKEKALNKAAHEVDVAKHVAKKIARVEDTLLEQIVVVIRPEDNDGNLVWLTAKEVVAWAKCKLSARDARMILGLRDIA